MDEIEIAPGEIQPLEMRGRIPTAAREPCPLETEQLSVIFQFCANVLFVRSFG